MKPSKEIRKFKIAVTSACCLRCVHCFIDKDRPLRVSPEAAGKGLDLFLRSHGKAKTLELYGGEPLLEFGLVKEIVAAAERKARALKKDLSVSLASNGLLAEPEHLAWLAEHGVRLSVSFSGGDRTQDFTRRFPSGKGTSRALRAKLPLLLSMGGGLHVIFCVHPRRARHAYADFRRLVELGFLNIGVECVHGAGWRPQEYAAFAAAMRRIAAFTAKEAAAGRFIMLEPFAEFFRAKSGDALFCPFLRDLEMFPDGTLSLYPYPFLRTPAERRLAAVGSAAAGLDRRFRDCSPSGASARCADCAESYYRLPGLGDGSRAYRLRTGICVEAVRGLAVRASSEPHVREYLKRLIALFKRGYT